jgi:hypothetical protein
MRAIPTSLLLSLCCALLAGAAPALAQGRSPAPSADEDMTLVTGTRFVVVAPAESTAKAQFMDARIPVTAFNETDHCIDQGALEAATAYFDTLGRELIEAGHFYFVPDDEVKGMAVSCEKLHRRAPQAWAAEKTRIIAFGRVVPTAMAERVERDIR